MEQHIDDLTKNSQQGKHHGTDSASGKRFDACGIYILSQRFPSADQSDKPPYQRDGGQESGGIRDDHIEAIEHTGDTDTAGGHGCSQYEAAKEDEPTEKFFSFPRGTAKGIGFPGIDIFA